MLKQLRMLLQVLKGTLDLKENKAPRVIKVPKVSKESKDHKAYRESKDPKEFRENKDRKEFKESKDHKAFREIKVHKVFREIRVHKAYLVTMASCQTEPPLVILLFGMEQNGLLTIAIYSMQDQILV